MTEWAEGPEEDVDFEYLDAVPLSRFGSPTAMSGCCELITYNGEPWVRMTGVGIITASYGARTVDYTVGKAHLDLLLFTGQSNSYYYTDPAFYDSESPVPPGKAFYFGTPEPHGPGRRYTPLAQSSTLASSGMQDLTAPDGSVRVAGSYPAILYNYWKATGHRVLIACSGVGGASISTFSDASGSSSLWTINVIGALLTAAEGKADLTPVAALWSQGEADYAKTVDWYEERLALVVENFCTGAYGIGFPKVLSSLPKRPEIASPTNPAVAQEAYAAGDARFEVASSLAVYLPDDVSGRTMSEVTGQPDLIHYSQKTYGWLGEALGRSAAEAEGSQPTEQTIVFAGDLGEVAELPAQVLARGTSGEGFLLDADWSEDGGAWTASLSGAPFGTIIAPGLTATASSQPDEEE